MSSVQKKRKNTSSSASGHSSSSSYGSIRGDSGSPDNREDDGKHSKQRSVAMLSGRMVRLWAIFVTVMCLLFYDISQVHRKIYMSIFSVSVQPLLSAAGKDATRKHHNTDGNVLIEDAVKLDVLLVRSGATANKNALLEQKFRLRRLMETGKDVGVVEHEGDSSDESGSGGFELFKDKFEVDELNKISMAHIEARAGKSVFTVRKEGYNLDSASLQNMLGSEVVHGKKQLEDFQELAAAAAAKLKQEQIQSKDLNAKKALTKADRNAKAVVDEITKSNKTLSRKMAFEGREPEPEFLKFVSELRADNTFAHIGKKNDMERALKLLGYKQSAVKSKKVPLWVGYDDKGKCPVFKKDEPKISICPFFIPQNKADQYAYTKSFASQVPKSKLKPDFYPLTWRLYKEGERRSLKLHCTNESMSEFGIAYVRKFTVPGSNYMKTAESIYDQLVKSEKKLKELKKETRNRAIVQLYINNPLLIEERKFIIRTFAVIVSGKPFIAYYHDGAVFRSIVKYKPFERHDAEYKKAAHITSEQKSAQKKVLKSSELYTSFNSLQTYLTQIDNMDEKYVNHVLRPQLKARMIYALYAILKRQRSTEDLEDNVDGGTEETLAANNEQGYKLINSAAVTQTSCFDFVLDEKKKIYLLNVATGPHCFINMGGSSFRPAWKVKMQEALSDNTVKLSEELLWRRMKNKPLSSMRFFTKTGMTVLVDETFPDWDVTTEINNHMDGIQVEQDNNDYNSQDENDELEIKAIIGGGEQGPGEASTPQHLDEEEEEEGDEPEEEED